MFHLTTTLSYGLRLLINLADHNQLPKPLKRIAGEEGISLPYLRKLIIPLEKSGLVKSTKGPGGGFILKRKAGQISLSEIVNIFSRSKVMDCAKGTSDCRRYQDCAAKDLMEEVYRKVQSVFKNKTLATIAKRRLK